MPRTRTELSIAKKINILDKIKTYPLKTSHRKLGELMGVSKSTIARLLGQEKELRLANESGSLSKCTRQRHGKDPLVEKALDKWFAGMSGQGVNLSGPILKQKSEELARKMGRYDFIATDGWLSRWKDRHQIVFKKIHGKKGSPSIISADEWRASKVSEILLEYDPDDVYNADETGLYYRATPDASLCYKHEALSSCKKAMDRLTVLCCVNMRGTDKKRLLVIGKSARPRCFNGLQLNKLPVQYCANKNAWMTAEIFKDWLHEWDAELSVNKRKIVLIVDNCIAHPHLDDLKFIRLEFLPPNTTAILQPLDMGIIKHLKTFYRKKLVNFILDSIEGKVISPTATSNDISLKISILQALKYLSESWQAITSTMVQHYYSACGFGSLEETPEVEVEAEEVVELNLCFGEDIYSNIDTNLICYNESDNLEEAIVSDLLSPNQEEIEDDDEIETPIISDIEAKNAVNALKQYFMQDGKPDCSSVPLDFYANLIEKHIINTRKHTVLDSILQI